MSTQACSAGTAICHNRYFTEGADEVAFLNITGFRDCPLEDTPMLGVSDTNNNANSRYYSHANRVLPHAG